MVKAFADKGFAHFFLCLLAADEYFRLVEECGGKEVGRAAITYLEPLA